MGLLDGKNGLVVGVANERSLAWGIARALHDAGARLVFTFQNEALEKRVRPLATSVGAPDIVRLDFSDEATVEAAVSEAAERLGELDLLVHSVAYADREALKGAYLDVSRDAFLQALEVSVYSLTSLCRLALPRMRRGASVITLTYLGSERAIRNYNVMGVAKAALESSVRYLAVDLGQHGMRINAISAGPVKTLSAVGVSKFSSILQQTVDTAALRRNISSEEVGSAALFLLSDLASGITGEVVHVDAGYSIVGA